MSELSANNDFSFVLAAGDLTQVAFSLFQVVLTFEKMTISIESPCEIISRDGFTWSWRPEQISDMTGFSRLLGSHLLSYRVLARDDRLMLTFSNGHELSLRGENQGYESFSIESGDIWIVIR
jgi:hypothetical protein